MAIDQRNVRVKCLNCGHVGTFLNGPNCLYCGAPLPPPGVESSYSSPASAPVTPAVARPAAVSEPLPAAPPPSSPPPSASGDPAPEAPGEVVSMSAAAEPAAPVAPPPIPGGPYGQYGQYAPPPQLRQPAPQVQYYQPVPWIAVQAPPKPKSRAGTILKAVGGALLALLLIAGVRLGAYAVTTGALGRLSLAGSSSTAASWSNVVYSDSLKTDDGTWANQDGCQFKSDGYYVSQGYACYAPISMPQDAQITATAKQDAGETDAFYGLVFRRSSAGNLYALVITSDGYWGVQKVVNTKPTFIVPQAKIAAVHTGLSQANVLRVRMSGSQFQFFINGTQVGQISDTTYDNGRVGVLGNEAAGVDVIFSDFSVALP